MEHADYSIGNEYFILLFAYDDPKSLEQIPRWNKVARNFNNITNLVFGHVDLTGAFFEGGWWYWSPLIRYYKLDLGFDYYYDDLKIKTMENWLKEKSQVFA